ncbi:MAG: hypothetical protein AB2L14_11090 [Candidatus Xenobiia bacterium LiM19]
MTIQDVSRELGYPMGAGSASDSKAAEVAAKQTQEPGNDSAVPEEEADTFTRSHEPGGRDNPEWNGVTMTKTPLSSKIMRKLRWVKEDMINGIKQSVDPGIIDKVKAGAAGAVTLGLPTAIVAGATILNPTLGAVAVIPSAIAGTFPGNALSASLPVSRGPTQKAFRGPFCGLPGLRSLLSGLRICM